MKNVLKTSALLLALLLYSHIVGFYSNNAIANSSSATSQPNKHNSSQITLLTNQNYSYALTNNSVNTLYRLTPTAVKKTLSSLTTCIKVREQFLLYQFTQYSFSFKYQFYRVVHTLLLFPFHYFW